MNQGAYFDPTGAYRYSLWRVWNPNALRLAFIMLNPSTADAQTNDATIRRCIQFAQIWGYGGLEVVNLFGFRSPHPQRLREVVDPVGAECNRSILKAVEQSDCTVIAWGNWGTLYGRDQAVLELLGNRPIHCLGLNQSGQPRHPLYLKHTVRPLSYPYLP
jgi:hypothetical protein